MVLIPHANFESVLFSFGVVHHWELSNRSETHRSIKVTRPSFFLGGGGYHPTLKLSGIPTFTFIVSLTHRMDNI